tara:strand:+ start:221 stop:523 length:303 start_codon:yes stop_codon:yes gene_type:complete
MLVEVVVELQLLDQMQPLIKVQQEELEHQTQSQDLTLHTLVVEVVDLNQVIQEQVVLVVEELQLGQQVLLEQLILEVVEVDLVVVVLLLVKMEVQVVLEL